jgi:HEAT repeat protein
MTSLPAGSSQSIASLRDLTPHAQACGIWLRKLARALRMFRLYKTDNPAVVATRSMIVEQLSQLVNQHGALDLRFTPTEIRLVDELVIAPEFEEASGLQAGEQTLSFQFYRDGIRRMVVLPGVPEDQALSLLSALRETGRNGDTHDDLVTLLWQGNLTHVLLETVPIEQTIYLSARPTEAEGDGRRGLSYAWTPAGSEVRAELGQITGAQGLHRDVFDDWPLPDHWAEVPAAYEALENRWAEEMARLQSEWAEEAATPWMDQLPAVTREMLALDPSDSTRLALIRAVVNWVAAAIERCDWSEAQRALSALRAIDPSGAIGEAPLTSAMSALAVQDIADSLDEDSAEDHARFTSLMVSIGRPALRIVCALMSASGKVRVRAAAMTAVCYVCSDHAEWLEPYLTDSRWYIVRNAVFALGQIGGDDVVPLLKLVTEHAEVRVRRALVQSLGNVSPDARVPLLLRQLSTRNAQLLAATLNMLHRDDDPRTPRAILAQIQRPDFESRSEDNKRALYNALGEMGDDSVVPALELLLNEGGWFARRTVERVAAARTLRRIGSPRAVRALEAGLRSKSEAVRAACLEAMSLRMHP